MDNNSNDTNAILRANFSDQPVVFIHEGITYQELCLQHNFLCMAKEAGYVIVMLKGIEPDDKPQVREIGFAIAYLVETIALTCTWCDERLSSPESKCNCIPY